MYDKEATGRVHYEDFRNMAEQFGMQVRGRGSKVLGAAVTKCAV